MAAFATGIIEAWGDAVVREAPWPMMSVSGPLSLNRNDQRVGVSGSQEAVA